MLFKIYFEINYSKQLQFVEFFIEVNGYTLKVCEKLYIINESQSIVYVTSEIVTMKISIFNTWQLELCDIVKKFTTIL